MSRKKSSAVILGLGGANALGVVRSLGQEGISVVGFHMGNRKSDAHFSKYIGDVSFVSDEKGLVQSLVNYGKSQDEKGVVFATGDDYTAICSINRETLTPYFHLPHSSIGDLSELIQKEENSRIGKRAGFKVPYSVLLSDYNNIRDTPVIVKPLSSLVGGKGDMRKYDSDKDLISDRDRLLRDYGDMLVQEFIPGGNDNLIEVHTYKSSKGVVIAGMQKNELSIQANPSVYMGVAFRSIWDDALLESSLRLTNELNFNGALDINLKKSSLDNKIYFMEVNLRTSANLSLDTVEGINLPAVIYRDLNGEDFNDLLFVKERKIGGIWLHEQRVKKFLGQGGSVKQLRGLLKDFNSTAFYDSEDVGPFALGDVPKIILPFVKKSK